MEKMKKRRNHLSQRELEVVKREIAERIRDMVYARAERNAEEIVDNIGNNALNELSENEYTINFQINFVAGDIQQIVARMRRRGNKTKKVVV